MQWTNALAYYSGEERLFLITWTTGRRRRPGKLPDMPEKCRQKIKSKILQFFKVFRENADIPTVPFLAKSSY
jgi:hypothetical protein